MICGGVDTLSPLTISGFSSLEVLSNQQTNPFSANRNGINIGEGAAVFVMSREPLDEHRIQLLGYGSSSDAYHMSSPHPEGEGAISAFQNALHNADLDAADIGWINLHGTGTLHNDQMESLAVAKIFGNQTACTTTKPYTGHTLGLPVRWKRQFCGECSVANTTRPASSLRNYGINKRTKTCRTLRSPMNRAVGQQADGLAQAALLPLAAITAY